MTTILDAIKSKKTLLADGALGTMLLNKNLPSGRPPEELNLTQKTIIEDICRAYLEAGADILQTNTFGASPLKLSDYNLEEKWKEINISAISLVKKVIMNNHSTNNTRKVYIAASCGPSGKILKPYGDCDPKDVLENFKKQIETLVYAEIDAIFIETMSDLEEAKLAVQAAREIIDSNSSSKNFVAISASMSFNQTPRGFYTMMGQSIEKVAKELSIVGADIIGANCGHGICEMIKVASEFRKHYTGPIIIEANAGLPTTDPKTGTLIYQETPQFFASKSKELIEMGVSIIGGCCGTTPAHITEIRKLL